MASITARNVSVVFPLVGRDKKFARPKEGENVPVGGRILRGQDAGILAIDNFSIDLKDGDRLGIFGHNGSGKSTLLRLLGGIYPPTTGSIDIKGTTAGMFSLSLGVNREATGLQNIQFKGLMHGINRREIAEMVPKIAELSELGDYLHLPVKTYSSGMVMRLMFATASLLNPDILLLDEWISTGDRAFQEKANHYLDELIDSKLIVIIASQNEKRLTNWSDNLICLENGRAIPHESIRVFSPDIVQVNAYRRFANLFMLDEALEQVERAWPLELAPFLHYSKRGAILTRMNENEEALKIFTLALDCQPDDPSTYNQIGVLKYKLGAYEEAINYLNLALKFSDEMIGSIKILELAIQKSKVPELQK